ncbi:MAG TPA: hypothetical protein VF045_10995 [Acidimicrobiales bacterium]
MAGSAVDEAIDELYRLPPGDFVAARTELVKKLKKEGNKESAATVAALRRPSAAAWAVNQLVRRRRSELEQLIGLGAALREAQAEAMAGADADELRSAARARREAVAAMADLAAAILAEDGSSPAAHVNAISATLEAATLDPDAGRTVLEGRLSTELEPPTGFGDGDFDLSARPARPARPAAKKAASPAKPSRSALEKRKAAEQAVEEARHLVDELSEEAVAAAGRAESARRAAEQAKAEVAELEQRLEAAEKRAREAAREADAAKRAATKAEAAVTDASKQLTKAENRLSELPDGDG